MIYDYWKDPWGRVHEHWTDTDVLNARHRPKLLPAEEGLRSQWAHRLVDERSGIGKVTLQPTAS